MSDASSQKTIAIEVQRYRPEQEDQPFWQTFAVPFTDDMSVLQGLQLIKDDQDGSLSFRWSCRMAICGSCGMMINGKPELSCKTFLRDLLPGPVRVEALAHFPIERDLVVSVDKFVEKLESIKNSSNSSSNTAAASTACFAMPPARSTGSTRTSSGRLRWPCCTATTPIRAMAAKPSGWKSSMRLKACGVARQSAIAPRSAPSMSTRPMR